VDTPTEAATTGTAPTSTQTDDATASGASVTSGASAASEPSAAPPAAGADDADKPKEFALQKSQTAKAAHGATASKIKATKTEAALKFVVVDKEKGPIKGIVIAVTAPDGKKFHTEETDAEGYAEVLVPNGQKYDLVYLSLGRQDIASSVAVSNEPRQNVKLTLRYKRYEYEAADSAQIVLEGINFDTGKATIRAESFPRLDGVVEYLAHKRAARIEISGHTDNVGNPKTNKALSQKRAQACRDYLISKGIDGGRVEAKGYGDERPIAPNDTEAGRQKNRRIEATPL